MRWLRALYVIVTVLVGIGAVAVMWGHTFSTRLQAEVMDRRIELENAHRMLRAVAEADAAFRGYLLYRQPQHGEALARALATLEDEPKRRLVAEMDRELALEEADNLASALAIWVHHRRRGYALINAGARDSVIEQGAAGRGTRETAEVRERVERFLAQRRAQLDGLKQRLADVEQIVLALVLASATFSAGALLAGWLLLRRREEATRAAQSGMRRSAAEVASLLRMSEMLQACDSVADVEAVASQAAREVLPGCAAALYLPASGAPRLDRAAAWGGDAPPSIGESCCWAMKRGRPHACGPGGGCDAGVTHALCLPVAARGEMQGILRVQGLAEGDRRQSLALALSDGVSLALANIALREKLRGEALRDPLTDLHNRRFLEESWDKLTAQARRRHSPVALLLIDLDHFKAINDRHGHAAGDAALRRVGAVLAQSFRAADLACRFGGEEFVVVLPDCGLAQALRRAEDVRRAIEQAGNDPPLSASIGVAAMPECGSDLRAALRAADLALYRAKAGGRNRVEAATREAPWMAAVASRPDAEAPAPEPQAAG
ncbi:MAG: diguanylate cyclase [Acetobacteraceae bacterium]|nr:diguanylate cyclase [Acetobacteraceae bacterium]